VTERFSRADSPSIDGHQMGGPRRGVNPPRATASPGRSQRRQGRAQQIRRTLQRAVLESSKLNALSLGTIVFLIILRKLGLPSASDQVPLEEARE